MYKSFDIVGQIGKEIEDFNTSKVLLAEGRSETGRYLGKNDKGYQFSQRDTLELIDLYYNSKFETGQTDSEGQRKLFLNISRFRADVAAKQIDLDTKDIVFIPDTEDAKWGAYYLTREFKVWARQTYFGELINEIVEDFPKYGTVVIKKVGKTLERVPIRNLINQQDAKDLECARYVIEKHEGMTLEDMKKYTDWDLTGVDLEYGQTTTVYERYGLVPQAMYDAYLGKESKASDTDMVKCVVVATCKEGKKKGQYDGNILFMEKIKELPYLELHWKKQDGRWLGIGEIENQFENQIARNMIANLRRRALLWSSKKVFQSPDEELPKNLVRDVKDGEIIRITPNGNITQVDMTTHSMAEFQSTEDVWEENSNQKSFTYEVATGEAMPSGTPFRLGVVLSNAVNSHFGLKREKLGIFLKKIISEFVLDIFKEQNSKEHIISIFGTDEGLRDLKKTAVEMEMSKRILDWARGDNTVMPMWEELEKLIEEEYNQKSHLFITIPDNFYDNVKNHVEIVTTGEEIDTTTKITTYTTLYQAMAQKGDPRADQILEKIMSLTGENLEAVLGDEKKEQEMMQMQTQQPQAPNLNALIPQQEQVEA